MQAQTETHTASDGAQIKVYHWLPEGSPRRTFHIVHGMAEHAARYERFAQALTGAGYAVYAQDLRGHGANAELTGHFADKNGWSRVVEDVAGVAQWIQQKHADLPAVLFGHSMGSFIAQQCLTHFGDELQAVILSATDKPPLFLRTAGYWAARIERWRRGARNSSDVLQTLSFGNFNRPFGGAQARTEFEWLSADPRAVDRYIADPLCGFPCTTETWCQLLAAIPRLQSRSAIQRMPKHTPVLLIAGDQDPVARDGAGPLALAALYRRAGMQDVMTRLYPGGRHELLNDVMRDEVTQDLLAWLDRRMQAA